MGVHLVRVLGREELLADICRRLDAFEGVLTLVGEPGIGKTTVWAKVLAGVQSAWSWSATCLEVEAKLGLAVLADLYAAAPDEVVGTLPAPQRRALDVVLYRDDPPPEGSITDRLLGVTTLSLLRGLATRGTTVLGIDDVQWCDPASLAALDYALHRLRGEPVGVLATRRVGGSRHFTGAAEVLVGPLADEVVRHIARAAAGGGVDESHTPRLRPQVAATRFFAEELSRYVAIGMAAALAVLDDRHEDAQALLREADIAARHGEVNQTSYFVGLLSYRLGHLRTSARQLREAMSTDGPNPAPLARLAMVHAWLGQPDVVHSRFGHAAAHRSRGFIALARGDDAAAARCFAESVNGFAALGVPLEAARAELALGSLLRRTGQRRRARAILESARVTFVRCDAAGLIRGTDTELAGIAGRRTSTPDELTASERRIVDLVVTGLRNHDVARELHLSVKTVETHLSRAYRKLGVPPSPPNWLVSESPSYKTLPTTGAARAWHHSSLRPLRTDTHGCRT